MARTKFEDSVFSGSGVVLDLSIPDFCPLSYFSYFCNLDLQLLPQFSGDVLTFFNFV